MTGRLDIDFAPPGPARLLAGAHPLVVLVAALGLGLCAAAGVVGHARWRHLQALDAAAGEAQAALSAATRRAPAPAAPAMGQAQAVALSGAVRQLNLPWRHVLDAVEAGTPKTLALLSIEPDPRRQVIRIEGEGGSDQDLLDYVKALKKQPFLEGVFLVKQAIDTSDPRHRRRFRIEAAWREGGQ